MRGSTTTEKAAGKRAVAKIQYSLILALAVHLLYGCGPDSSPDTASRIGRDWSRQEAWFQDGRMKDTSLVDVFYVLPTCVVANYDRLGNETFYANPEDSTQRAGMQPSYELASRIFADSANFFAPYYHQLTLKGWTKPEEEIQELLKAPMKEVCEAFDHYLKNWNGGRKFILAGFSQGGKGVIELLRHMDDETYQRLIGAYAIGYRITEEDLECTGERLHHVVPASSALDQGVTVCYNTVMDPSSYEGGSLDESMLGITSRGGRAVINPASWSLDTLPHALNDSVSIRIDRKRSILIATGLDARRHFVESLSYIFPRGNLHLWELTLYQAQLRQNVHDRIRASRP